MKTSSFGAEEHSSTETDFSSFKEVSLEEARLGVTIGLAVGKF